MRKEKEDTMSEAREPYPSWRYRGDGDGGIEKRLFEHPDDAPAGEGWVDSPAYVKSDTAPPERQIEAPGGETISKYADMGWKELRAEYKKRMGKGPRPSMKADDLIRELTA